MDKVRIFMFLFISIFMEADESCENAVAEDSDITDAKAMAPTATMSHVATKILDQPVKSLKTEPQILTPGLPGQTGEAPAAITEEKSQHKYAMRAIGSVVCRICHNAENPERLISPCCCKGTLAYVHRQCLEHWLSTSGIAQCELCNYRFQTKQTLRYKCIQSLRLWYNHPNNRGLLQADFLVCSLLTVVSFGLVGISMMALQYFFIQGKRLGVSRLWTQFSILVFLVVISTVYCVNMGLILKAQLVPWYRWWQSAKDVTLILENRKQESQHMPARPEKNVNLEEVVLESNSLSEATNQPPAPVPVPVIVTNTKNPIISV